MTGYASGSRSGSLSTATTSAGNGKKMLKLTKMFDECHTCDYHYIKGDVSGCIFPNHTPIDSQWKGSCNTGEDSGIEVDEDYVQIKNIARVVVI